MSKQERIQNKKVNNATGNKYLFKALFNNILKPLKFENVKQKF